MRGLLQDYRHNADFRKYVLVEADVQADRQKAFARLSVFVERARRMQGWTFDEVQSEPVGPGPSWDYVARARELTLEARSVLDMATGGGEAFSTICE